MPEWTDPKTGEVWTIEELPSGSLLLAAEGVVPQIIPAQAMPFVRGEINKRAWTRIDPADPATLPAANDTYVLVAYHSNIDGVACSCEAGWDGTEFDPRANDHDCEMKDIYAWMRKPPAPDATEVSRG